MRVLIATIILLATSAWSVESSHGLRQLPEERGLTQEQVEHYAGAYLPAIRACYVEHASGLPSATGELRISATVLRSGSPIAITVEAPGVTGRRLRSLVSCVRDAVETWRFPVNRDDTAIVIPYRFQRVYAPGAGPQYSCWDPKGCRTPDKHGHR